jgi:multidrug efflux pump
VDRERAALYDLSTMEVGNAVRAAINGVEAAKYRTGNDEYDIIVRLAERYRHELESLRELTVMAEGGIQVPSCSWPTWSVEDGLRLHPPQGPGADGDDHVGRRGGLNSNAVLAEVQQDARGLPGERAAARLHACATPASRRTRTRRRRSWRRVPHALMLIGFILISQFNSVVKPVIILTSVIMSTVGVLIGLMIFQMPFGIINTGVGIISLAGIVVNNAIILIDYIDVLRAGTA